MYNDYESSYECILIKSNALSLTMLGLKYMIIYVYKCINKLNPEYVNDLCSIKDPNYSMRDESIASNPHSKIKRLATGLFHIMEQKYGIQYHLI